MLSVDMLSVAISPMCHSPLGDMMSRHAREPKTDTKDANRLHQLYVDEIRRRLVDRDVCSRLEYKGSAYEGVKVPRSDNDSDIEFDIMVILRRETDLQVSVCG